MQTSIGVLTLNVWNREGPWELRRQLLREWLERLHPDLIGLQEVMGVEQTRELFGSNYHCVVLGQGSGVAIVSRWPLRDRVELTLSEGDEPGWTALRACVESPYGTISFCCATTPFFQLNHGYKRERCLPQLARFARGETRNGDFPPILVGDFNADDESAEIRYLRGLQSLHGSSAYFVDAWRFAGDGSAGATWSRDNGFVKPWRMPNRRIDYIFVGHPRSSDGAGVVEQCAVVCNERDSNGHAQEVWPSDHYGVFAKLRA